jgi:hypothetical protein
MTDFVKVSFPRDSCVHTGCSGTIPALCFGSLVFINEALHYLRTELFSLAACKLDFTLHCVYVQLLPRCFVAIVANSHATYILGSAEKLSKHDMTQLTRLTSG